MADWLKNYGGIGADFSAFRTEKHFASWLMLAPRQDVSGGNVIRHLSFSGNNRVANGLKWQLNHGKKATATWARDIDR